MSFESELAEELAAMKTNIDRGIKLVADEIFVNLCENSPSPGSSVSGGRNSEYSLGSFVLSHRISGGVADISTTQVGGEADATAVAEAFANELPKLDSITPFQDIVIANSIEYNERIEHLGWSIGAGPYHTFQNTEGTMDTIAQRVLGGI
jgi:hypothetical protein